MKDSKSLTNRIKSVGKFIGKKVVLPLVITGATYFCLSPQNAYAQTQNKNASSQSINKGVSFGTNKIGGKDYNIERTAVHGVPYLFSEVKKSEENTLGVESSPYLMERVGKKVVYVPQEMSVERIVLEQDGPFGIKGDKKAFTFNSFLDNTNPMGGNINYTEKNYSGNISTMILPSGDTTYFFYNTTNKNAINKGDELNFMTVTGDSIKSDDKGNLYIEGNGKNKFYKWVKDAKRSTAKTSIDKKVIDTTFFSVIKSNKEIPELKNYESKVDSAGQYETVISGTQNKELKYTVVRSPTKLKSLENDIGFKKTYCQSNGNYTYTIESDKIKIEDVKNRKDLVAINGTIFKKKAVSTEPKKVEVPFNNKIIVKGNIYEYTVPVGDLNKLKIACDSCETSSKYKVDTTFVAESLVLNPDYPAKYLDKIKSNITTGEVDTIFLANGEIKARKEKKIKKESVPKATQLILGAEGNYDYLALDFGVRYGNLALVLNSGVQKDKTLEDVTTEPTPRGLYGQGIKEQLNTSVLGTALEYYLPINHGWELFAGAGANKWDYDIKNTEKFMKAQEVITENTNQQSNTDFAGKGFIGIMGKKNNSAFGVKIGYDSKAKFFGGLRFNYKFGKK